MRARRVRDPPAPVCLVVVLEPARFGDRIVDRYETVSGVVLVRARGVGIGNDVGLDKGVVNTVDHGVDPVHQVSTSR